MSTLSITARRFKELVTPVLAHASTDIGLPVLNTVRIETHGRWLVAIATDRFRMALHRIERPEENADDWDATIPLGAVKGIISTFAPRRGLDADLTLVTDGESLTASADGGALAGGFFEASFRWPLEAGEFPKVANLLLKTIAVKETLESTKVRMDFLSDFKSADPHGSGLWVKATGSGPRSPVIVTDGENFVGMVMPRLGNVDFPDLSSWSGVLSDADPDSPVVADAEAVAS